MPNSSRVWPLRPKINFTEVRSGSFRPASPPASAAGCASKAVALKSNKAEAAKTRVNIRLPTERAASSTICMKDPPEDLDQCGAVLAA